jgi:hypothetical protein
MVRKFENGSEEIHYRFDGRSSRNKLPGTGGALDNTYSFISRWDGDKLVTDIVWEAPQGKRSRTETISINNGVLTIETVRPAARGAGDPYVVTSVFQRKN